jgi:phosphoglycerate dehydrogenase-like enzyme
MKIVFHYHLAGEYRAEVSAFSARFPADELRIADSDDDAALLAESADVLVTANFALIERATRLQYLVLPFTGVNSVPRDMLEGRGIRLVNNHGNAGAVAERAVALALAAAGRVAEFDKDLRRGEWHRNPPPAPLFDFWTSIEGSAVAILGTGAIGSGIARRLAGFRCHVTGFRRTNQPARPPHFHEVTSELHAALKDRLLVFIALPLTEATRGLIGERELELFGGGVLVNVARGAIVEEEALYQALASGELLAAGLDSWYRSPSPPTARAFPANYPFHELSNVVLSPHAASHAESGKRGQLEGVFRNLEAILSGDSPPDLVDLTQGY